MNNFIYNPPKTPFLTVLYEDEYIMVVDKPSGLLSVPGREKENYDSILSRIWETYPDAMAVHRLDMDTSGLMVVGLQKESISALGKMFMQKEVHKLYYALVDGRIEAEGKIELPIRCDLDRRPLQIVDFEQGKPSTTLFERVDNFCVASFVNEKSEHKTDDISLVRLTPVTGRSHQLRVHLASIGHAILGDRFYADDKVQAKSKRLCLHAYHLEFNHPISKEKLSFETKAEFLI